MINRKFVLKELNKVTTPKISGESAFIICPFHEDTSPSLGISLGGKMPVGVFHCLGCQASGSYNALALKIGMRTVEGKEPLESTFYVNKEKVKLFQTIDEDTLSLSSLKKNFKWKKYNRKFLQEFGVQRIWHDKFSDYYLYFPVTYLGDYKGYIRGRLYKKSYGPKYWFGLEQRILYPIDYLLEFNTPIIVLVEGIADALRLIKNKIPALATLGSQLTSFGFEILEVLGIKGIILCFDGDDSGKRSVLGNGDKRGLAYSLTKENYDVRVLFPPKDEDPDSMPFEYIKVLKHLIIEMKGELL